MDLSPAQIRQALDAGIIGTSQADALLERHGATLTTPEAAPLIGNEVNLRFLRSFSDIFITLGVVLLMVGVFMTASALDSRESGFGDLAAAGVFWGLAEWFGRRRRQHLPTLALSIGYAVALASFVALFFADRWISFGSIGRDWFVPAATFLAGLVFFYWRIRLPFVFMLLGWGATAFVFGTVGSLGLIENLWVLIGVGFVCAAGLLAAALLYDIRDPERVQRFSDNGFWLHSVASPVTLLSFMALGAKITFGDRLTTLEGLAELRTSADGLAVWMIFVIVLSVLWGLAINRRVFVISTLAYSIVVLIYLLSRTQLDPTLVASLGLLVVGAIVVLLGVAWHPLRGALLRVLPNWKIFPRPVRTDI